METGYYATTPAVWFGRSFTALISATAIDFVTTLVAYFPVLKSTLQQIHQLMVFPT